MSHNETFVDAVQTLADCIQAGRIARAKQLTATTLNGADAETLMTIAFCVRTIETYPIRCADMLRAKWQATRAPAHRALIAVFGKALSARRSKPAPHTRTSKTRDTAPRNERTEIRREAVHSLTADRRAHLRLCNTDNGLMHAYAQDEQPHHEPATNNTPYGNGLDYDRAAVHDLHGLPCVRCWTERTSQDQQHTNDALCAECREKGREGITVPDNGNPLAAFVQARCEFIAAHYPQAALKILRRWWTSSPRCQYADATGTCRCNESPKPCGARAVIAQWISHNPLHSNAQPTSPVRQRPKPDKRRNNPNCDRCGAKCAARSEHNLCDDCTEVDQLIAA